MASTILIKRSQGSSAPVSLSYGELAYAFGSQNMYIGDSDGTITLIGGKSFVDLLDHTAGTLTASSAIIVDANSKIDQLNVDLLTLDSNYIATSAGDLVLAPFNNVNVTGAKITGLGTPTVDSDAATKLYVDNAVAGFGADLTINGDTGTDTVNLADSDLTFVGGTALTSAVTNNTVTFNLDNTAVTPQEYGDSDALLIPRFTVDQQGRITAASEWAFPDISLTINGDTGTDGVNLFDSDLTFTGSGAIGTAVTNNTVTISVDDATVTTKGVASFDSDHFSVTAGAVTIAAASIENADLAGSISNDKLVNSSITIGTDAVSLGSTITDLNGLTSLDVDNITIDGAAITSTTGTVTVDDNLTVTGNLTVQGTTTTVNSTEVTIVDKNILLASNVSADSDSLADGGGISIGADAAALTWVYNGGQSYWDVSHGMIAHVDGAGGALKVDALYVMDSDLATPVTYAEALLTEQLLAGEGIDLTFATDQLTISAEDATSANKGIASFDANDFTVTAGAVTLNTVDGGTF